MPLLSLENWYWPSDFGKLILVKLIQRHWNTGLVSSRASHTSWGEVASLALVGNPSSDGVTIKMPSGVDLLNRPVLHPIFSYGVGWNWIWLYFWISWDWLREMNTGGSLSFFVFLRPDLSPWGYRCFLVALCCFMLRRLNLEVATKSLLHQQVKIPG